MQLGSYRARHDNPIPSLPQPQPNPKLQTKKPKPNRNTSPIPSPGPSPSPSRSPLEAQNQARHLGPGLRQRQPPQPQPNRVAREQAARCAMMYLTTYLFLPTPPNLLGSRTLVRYILSQTHTREEPIQVAYVPKGQPLIRENLYLLPLRENKRRLRLVAGASVRPH